MSDKIPTQTLTNSQELNCAQKKPSPNTGYAFMSASPTRGKFTASRRTGEFAVTSHSQSLGDIEKKLQTVRSGSLKSIGNLTQKFKPESWKNLILENFS